MYKSGPAATLSNDLHDETFAYIIIYLIEINKLIEAMVLGE